MSGIVLKASLQYAGSPLSLNREMPRDSNLAGSQITGSVTMKSQSLRMPGGTKAVERDCQECFFIYFSLTFVSKWEIKNLENKKFYFPPKKNAPPALGETNLNGNMKLPKRARKTSRSWQHLFRKIEKHLKP